MYLPFFVARLAVRRDPRYVVRGTAKRWNLTTGTAHEQSEYIMAVLESARGIERMCAFDNSTGNTELSG